MITVRQINNNNVKKAKKTLLLILYKYLALAVFLIIFSCRGWHCFNLFLNFERASCVRKIVLLKKVKKSFISDIFLLIIYYFNNKKGDCYGAPSVQ